MTIPINNFGKWTSNLTKTYRPDEGLVIPDNRRRNVIHLRIMGRGLELEVRRMMWERGMTRENMSAEVASILAAQIRRRW